MHLLSLFHTLDSLHNIHVSNKWSAFWSIAIYFTSVWYIQFEIWARNGSYAFLTVKNVFIDLPTGSEKSIIYQLAPLVSSRLENLSPNSGLGKSDAIHAVVSPLISLMFFARMFPLDWIAILKFCFIPFNFSRQLWCFKISPWHIDLKTKWASFVGRSIPILRTSISIFRFTFPFPEHSPIQRGDILLHR